MVSPRTTCFAAVVALGASFLQGAHTGRAEPRDPLLAHVQTWTLALDENVPPGQAADRFAGFDLVVLDGEATSKETIAELQTNRKIVLGYLSIGTIERGRWWYQAARHYRLDLWEDWGEWYADTSRRGFRKLIARQVAPKILGKGFDGLFLDNTDMIESHPTQTRGMRILVRSLSRLVDKRPGVLFAQNGEDSIGPLIRYYDGWNREDVSFSYDFRRKRYVRQPAGQVREAQNALRRLAARGLLVTATDYVSPGDDQATAEAVANACAAGALPFVSDIGLRGRDGPLPC